MVKTIRIKNESIHTELNDTRRLLSVFKRKDLEFEEVLEILITFWRENSSEYKKAKNLIE